MSKITETLLPYAIAPASACCQKAWVTPRLRPLEVPLFPVPR
jgi:hypothetical protein